MGIHGEPEFKFCRSQIPRFFLPPTEFFFYFSEDMPATDLHLAAKVGEMDEAEKFLAIEENKARWVTFATRVAACLSCTWHLRFAAIPPSNNISERRINETDSTGWTALHWAASRSRVSGALCPGVHAGVFSGLCWPRTAAGRVHNPTDMRVVGRGRKPWLNTYCRIRRTPQLRRLTIGWAFRM
jgi:hypothetical protein